MGQFLDHLYAFDFLSPFALGTLLHQHREHRQHFTSSDIAEYVTRDERLGGVSELPGEVSDAERGHEGVKVLRGRHLVLAGDAHLGTSLRGLGSKKEYGRIVK